MPTNREYDPKHNPTKEELEEDLKIPGATFQDLMKAAVQTTPEWKRKQEEKKGR